VTRRPERVDYDAAQKDLRRFLHAWDPIGIHEFPGFDLEAPVDEYDCFIPGLYRRLREGETEQEIHYFLSQQLVDHFGIEPRPEIDSALAAELVVWWNARPNLS
jgi:hypothetical protein